MSKPDRAPSKPKARIKPPIWVTATGSPITRVRKARYYLRMAAWVPTKPEDRSNALLVVMCNLRLYHRLSDPLAVAMALEHYSPRCMDDHGNPLPWTAAEVRTYSRRACARWMYPSLGASDPKAIQKAAVLCLQREVENFLRKRTTAGGCCNPSDLRNAFIAFRAGVDINPTAFGRSVFAVMGIRTSTPFGKRVYRGFQILETGSGLGEKPRQMGNAA